MNFCTRQSSQAHQFRPELLATYVTTLVPERGDGDLISKCAAARRKCQLAQIMHKNSPRPCQKRVVGAHRARSGASPARSGRLALRNKAICLHSLAAKELGHNLATKLAFLTPAAGNQSGASQMTQVAGWQAVKAGCPQLGPGARIIPNIDSIDIRLWSKYLALGDRAAASPNLRNST
jgi:hypothetical protein